ncbi:uncharacterized protein LOC143040318 [Oratosquilla oratoria]|uniref:uncharacterized protein LOC143040318 n=1 Tax=Oratosquilla oratoria TaxID=337810 RepID=UPI003F7582C7
MTALPRLLILHLLLVPVLSSEYATKNVEFGVITEILQDIKVYMEDFPQVTNLAVKIAALETSLLSKSEALIELRALTKAQDEKLLDCAIGQRESSSKIADLENLVKELDKRLLKFEAEEIEQVVELKITNEKVVKGEQDVQELKSEMSKFKDLLQDLDKNDGVKLKEVDKAVEKLQKWQNQHEEKGVSFSKRLQDIESKNAESNESLSSISGRLDTLKEFVHKYHTKDNAITLCPLPYVKVGPDCFLMGTTEMKWPDARIYCQGRAKKIGGEGDLAVPTDRETFVKYIESQTSAGMYLWMGGSDSETEGKWKWLTGEFVDEESFPWDDGEPDSNSSQNYLCIATKAGARYHDCINEATLQFVCQLF